MIFLRRQKTSDLWWFIVIRLILATSSIPSIYGWIPTTSLATYHHRIPIDYPRAFHFNPKALPRSSISSSLTTLDENQYHDETEDSSSVVGTVNGVISNVNPRRETAIQEENRTDDNSRHADFNDPVYEMNLQLSQLAVECSRRNTTASRLAYEVFRSIPNPDTVSYNSVLHALTKASSKEDPDAAKVVQDLLYEMEEIHQLQVERNQQWYERNRRGNLTTNELSEGPPRIRVKPNVRSYSTVMDAWGRQETLEGAQRAQALLSHLQERYAQTGDLALQPNAISYNTVMNAWAKSGGQLQAAEQCELLLQQMGDMADVISYNAVLHAWARSGAPDAGRMAERLLRDMKKVQPNGRTYTTVMDAWSRSYGCKDSAQRAYDLLQEMESLEGAQGNNETNKVDLKPNFVSYSTVINAYALSKTEPFKAHKAYSLLQRMVRMYKETKDPSIRPNRVVYNSVLNACATSNPNSIRDTAEAENLNLPTIPDMVRVIYHQLLIDESLKPDHYTFGTVFKAIANSFWGEPDQVDFCRQVFREACDRGQVTFGVLFQLRQAAPNDVYRTLLPQNAYNPQNGHFSLKHIPHDWTRNVRENSKRRSR